MKWIVLSLLVLIVSVEARENPFEPTTAYLEEEQRILEVEHDYSQEFQAKENPDLETMSPSPQIISKPTPTKPVVKNEVKETEQKTDESHIKKLLTSISNQLKVDEQAQSQENGEQSKDEMQKEEVAANETKESEATEPVNEEATQPTTQENVQEAQAQEQTVEKEEKQVETVVNAEEQIIEDSGIPSENQVVQQTYDATPFVSIKSFADRLEIHTNNKVYRKFNLLDVSKIVIDFHAQVNFYTKRMDLNSDYFDEVAVGNHKKEQYYRVVIKTTQDPQSYKVTHRPGIVTIYNP